MDGSAYRSIGKALDLLFSWPVLTIFGIGILSILAMFGYGAWWIISHLQWVW